MLGFSEIYTLFCNLLQLLMKAFLSERNLVVLLFVMVLITFSLAQEDSKKMEKMYTGANAATASTLTVGYQLKIPAKVQLSEPPME